MEINEAMEIVDFEIKKQRKLAELFQRRGENFMRDGHNAIAEAMETLFGKDNFWGNNNWGTIINFVIRGDPVTKKNSQRIFRAKNGRLFIKPSEAFERYQEAAGMFIPQEARSGLDGPVNVKCVYFMPTRRRVDLVNLLEATCDILVHYGVLADDNSRIVVSHDESRVLYDKNNPRVEIEIMEVKGNA